MSHFYGYLRGSRGTATRCGHKTTGISAEIKSWNNSVSVSLRADEESKDKCVISIPDGLPVNINGIDFVIKEGKIYNMEYNINQT